MDINELKLSIVDLNAHRIKVEMDISTFFKENHKPCYDAGMKLTGNRELAFGSFMLYAPAVLGGQTYFEYFEEHGEKKLTELLEVTYDI